MVAPHHASSISAVAAPIFIAAVMASPASVEDAELRFALMGEG